MRRALLCTELFRQALVIPFELLYALAELFALLVVISARRARCRLRAVVVTGARTVRIIGRVVVKVVDDAHGGKDQVDKVPECVHPGLSLAGMKVCAEVGAETVVEEIRAIRRWCDAPHATSRG